MTVFDVVKENKAKSNAVEAARSNKEREERISKVAAADSIRALGKQYKDLTVVQLKVLLTALKRKGDAAIPSRRADIVSRLTISEHREPLVKKRAVSQRSSSIADILSNSNDDK